MHIGPVSAGSTSDLDDELRIKVKRELVDLNG